MPIHTIILRVTIICMKLFAHAFWLFELWGVIQEGEDGKGSVILESRRTMECTVCLEQLAEGDMMRVLPCLHKVNQCSCLLFWCVSDSITRISFLFFEDLGYISTSVYTDWFCQEGYRLLQVFASRCVFRAPKKTVFLWDVDFKLNGCLLVIVGSKSRL